jgi:hypothetical protein
MREQSETGTPGEPAALARLRLLGPQWRSAADTAFAAVAGSPERYLAAGRWVAAWLERLRGLPPGRAAGAEEATAEQAAAEQGVTDDGVTGDGEAGDAAAAVALLAAWDARDSAASDCEAPVPLSAAERSALTATAFAIRYAEVTDWLAARRRRRAMAAAGPGWLVLDEAGDAAGDPFIPYRRLEVDPVNGTGVLVETHPDDHFATVIHRVQVIHVDPSTGVLTVEKADISWEFSSVQERETLVASIRADGVPGTRHNGR